MNRKERIVLLLLAAINFTYILDFMIMMPLGNYLMPFFNISSRQFSLLISAYFFSAGVSGFIASFFIDRFNRKTVLLLAYTGFLIGILCCAFSPTYSILLLCRILVGVFSGLIGSLILTIAADLTPYLRRGKAMGVVMVGYSVAALFGVPFSLYLANIFNWNGIYFFIGGVVVILLPLLIRYFPKMDGHLAVTTTEKVDPFLVLKDISKSRNQVLALVLTATIMLSHYSIIPFLNPFLEFNKGFSKAQIPIVYLVGGALTLFTSPFLGKLADRIGKHRLFIILSFIATIPIAIFTNLPDVSFYSVLVVTGFWFILGSGRVIPAQALISNVVSTAHRGSFMSVNSSVQQIFIATASLIAGLVVVKTPENTLENYEITGYISIAFTLISVFVISKLHSRTIKPGLVDEKKGV